MPTPTELRARAAELESRVSPITAGPRTDDERMWLEKAGELRAQAERLESDPVPGTGGTPQHLVTKVNADRPTET
jgi:hypothetical protein